MTARRYAVTGSSGFLGAALVREFQRRGAFVYGMARRPGTEDAFVPYDLASGVVPDVPADIDGLVHAAWSFDPIDEPSNVNGTIGLFDRCARLELRNVLFVSSMSAHARARSRYATAKFEIENRARAYGYASVRPGFLLGAGDRRIGRAIGRLTRLPIVPVFVPDRPMLHFGRLDDVAAKVVELAQKPADATTPHVIAARRAHSLGDLVKHLGRTHGRKTAIAPVLPGELALSLLRFAEGCLGPLPLTSDSLAGLLYAPPAPGENAIWHALADPLADA